MSTRLTVLVFYKKTLNHEIMLFKFVINAIDIASVFMLVSFASFDLHAESRFATVSVRPAVTDAAARA
jgi:hypothetical protein